MVSVDQELFVKAVQTAAEVASKATVEEQKKIRIFIHEGELQLMASAGSIATCRRVTAQQPTTETFDVVVQGDRLLAAAKALRKGDVLVSVKEHGFWVEQGDGLEVELDTGDLNLFPTVPSFEKMVHIYTGPNPVSGFEAIKHIATTNSGTTPLAKTLMMLPGRSYLASQTSAVRCELSLVGVEDVPPIPLVLDSTWALAHLVEPLACYHEERRILVMDSTGWVTISKYGGEIGKFPETIEKTFASLKQLGQVKIPRVDALRAAGAANTVLRGATKEAVYMQLDCADTKITMSAAVGRHRYKETITGWSSGQFKIPVHIGRLTEFLRGSEDEAVYIRIMDSSVIPAPMQFVHLVDSRLHEVIGLPTGMKVELTT